MRESPTHGVGSGAIRCRTTSAPAVRILAIDQGTSATKAVVFGEDGEIADLRRGRRHAAGRRGRRGRAGPRAAVGLGLRGRDGRPSPERAAASTAVGFANQGETVLAWDRGTGRPLSTAISWQDRRAAAVCARLADDAEWLTRTTGLPLDPYFAAPKMAWLRRNVTTEGVVTTSDAWLLHRLTGAYVTDVTTASRTLLLDLERARGRTRPAPPSASTRRTCPEVVGSAEEIGRTDAFGPSAAGHRVQRRPAGGPGRGALPGAGESKCTYGTGAFLLANAGPRPVAVVGGGLAVSVAWQLGDAAAYCIDGQVYAAGAAVAWLQRWGFLRPGRGSRRRRRLGRRQRRRHRGAGPQRPRRAVVATRRPGQHRGHRPGHRARPRGPGHASRVWPRR